MLGRGEWRYRGTGSGLTGMRFPSEKQTHEARVGINDEKRSAFILGEFSGRAQRKTNQYPPSNSRAYQNKGIYT